MASKIDEFKVYCFSFTEAEIREIIYSLNGCGFYKLSEEITKESGLKVDCDNG